MKDPQIKEDDKIAFSEKDKNDEYLALVKNQLVYLTRDEIMHGILKGRNNVVKGAMRRRVKIVGKNDDREKKREKEEGGLEADEDIREQMRNLDGKKKKRRKKESPFVELGEELQEDLRMNGSERKPKVKKRRKKKAAFFEENGALEGEESSQAKKKKRKRRKVRKNRGESQEGSDVNLNGSQISSRRKKGLEELVKKQKSTVKKKKKEADPEIDYEEEILRRAREIHKKRKKEAVEEDSDIEEVVIAEESSNRKNRKRRKGRKRSKERIMEISVEEGSIKSKEDSFEEEIQVHRSNYNRSKRKRVKKRGGRRGSKQNMRGGDNDLEIIDIDNMNDAYKKKSKRKVPKRVKRRNESIDHSREDLQILNLGEDEEDLVKEEKRKRRQRKKEKEAAMDIADIGQSESIVMVDGNSNQKNSMIYSNFKASKERIMTVKRKNKASIKPAIEFHSTIFNKKKPNALGGSVDYFNINKNKSNVDKWWKNEDMNSFAQDVAKTNESIFHKSKPNFIRGPLGTMKPTSKSKPSRLKRKRRKRSKELINIEEEAVPPLDTIQEDMQIKKKKKRKKKKKMKEQASKEAILHNLHQSAIEDFGIKTGAQRAQEMHESLVRQDSMHKSQLDPLSMKKKRKKKKRRKMKQVMEEEEEEEFQPARRAKTNDHRVSKKKRRKMIDRDEGFKLYDIGFQGIGDDAVSNDNDADNSWDVDGMFV